MAVIDMGSEASNRATAYGGYDVFIVKDNPANETGQVTSVEIWASVNMTDVKVAIFYSTGTNKFTTRDNETIGSVTAGSKQTFSGLTMDCNSGDYIGMYFAAGGLEADASGYEGAWNGVGDFIPCTDKTFSFTSGRTVSLYATGSTTASSDNPFFFGMNF